MMYTKPVFIPWPSSAILGHPRFYEPARLDVTTGSAEMRPLTRTGFAGGFFLRQNDGLGRCHYTWDTSLSLDPGGDIAGDEIPLEDDKEDCHGDGGDHRDRHQHRVIRVVHGPEVRESHGQRVEVARPDRE